MVHVFCLTISLDYKLKEILEMVSPVSEGRRRAASNLYQLV